MRFVEPTYYVEFVGEILVPTIAKVGQRKKEFRFILLTSLIVSISLLMGGQKLSASAITSAQIDVISVLLMDASQRFGSTILKITSAKNIQK